MEKTDALVMELQHSLRAFLGRPQTTHSNDRTRLEVRHALLNTLRGCFWPSFEIGGIDDRCRVHNPCVLAEVYDYDIAVDTRTEPTQIQAGYMTIRSIPLTARGRDALTPIEFELG